MGIGIMIGTVGIVGIRRWVVEKKKKKKEELMGWQVTVTTTVAVAIEATVAVEAVAVKVVAAELVRLACSLCPHTLLEGRGRFTRRPSLSPCPHLRHR
jgi:hypothetical protein